MTSIASRSSGRLTRDPELKHLPSGSAVLGAEVSPSTAASGRRSGQWVDKPNFFDVKVFGNQAEMLSQHLAKGRRIGVDGRLDWSSWESPDGGKRSKVEVDRSERAVPRQPRRQRGRRLSSCRRARRRRAAAADFAPSPADDDIPF